MFDGKFLLHLKPGQTHELSLQSERNPGNNSITRLANLGALEYDLALKC